MATAIKKPIPPAPPPPNEYVLTLTEEEAKLIYAIGNWTANPAGNKRAKTMYEIYSALREAGVHVEGNPFFNTTPTFKGGDC